MLSNKFITKSNKFLCLGLSILTAASIPLSVKKAEAIPAPQTFTVTNINDSGDGSLRQAILNANADSSNNPSAVDVINFNLGTGAQTITLTSATLNITANNLTITGTGANMLTISGNNKLEDFNIATGANVTRSDLTITNGYSQNYGGGINNDGTLSLSNDTISNSTAVYGGGGIFNDGTLTITNVSVQGLREQAKN